MQTHVQNLRSFSTKKELKQVQNALEAEIAADMERQGLTQTGNDACTISLKTEVVPTVEDWDVLASTHKRHWSF